VIPREQQELPIDLVDEPPAPSRLPEELLDVDELAVSIKALGQLQPGGVVPDGDRYVVIYGHRRLLACRVAGLEFYSAWVYASTSDAMLAHQLAENRRRKDLNAVEEAYWFAQLLEYVGGDTTALAEHLNEGREYVERRLNLLRGDPAVLQALRDKKIRIGVAERLNAYPHDGDRLVLLDAAAAGGATERLVAQWIAERGKLIAAGGQVDTPDADATAAARAAAPPEVTKCFMCDSPEHAYLMQPIWIHGVCFDMLKRIVERHGGGIHAAQPVSR
jgi:ParB/RepB/Spo0J family partition protein